MNKRRRYLVALPGLCLCLALTLSALAEGMLGTLYQAGTRLLFDTENAAISAHAQFSFNGLPFKTADVVYLQDGVDSQMDVKLQTPKYNGDVFESGFTVVGNGTVSYAIDPVDNRYVYNTSTCAESNAILSSNALRRALVRLGGAVVSTSESAFTDKITLTEGEGAAQYRVQLREGQTPALVNAAGTVLWQLAAQRFFYVDYGYWGQSQAVREEEQQQVIITYDDYMATFDWQYQQLFGEKVPENFYDVLWGDDGEQSAQANARYQQVQDALFDAVVAPIRESYTGGVAVIRSDGSVDYYETTDQYYVDNDLQMVDFANFDAAYCAYYQKVTGSELTVREVNAIYQSDNDELISAYGEIYDKMMAEYMKLVRDDGKASLIYVNADGSYRMIYDYEAYSRSHAYDGETVTRRILRSMEALELGDTDFTVTLDEEGRITAAQGTLGLVVIDASGFRDQLEVVFDVAVDQYGQTHVDAFDPQAFGVMSYQEYLEKGPEELPARETEAQFEIPQTIMFNGVSYQVVLDAPVDEDL